MNSSHNAALGSGAQFDQDTVHAMLASYVRALVAASPDAYTHVRVDCVTCNSGQTTSLSFSTYQHGTTWTQVHPHWSDALAEASSPAIRRRSLQQRRDRLATELADANAALAQL